jgi:hypothetical protein
MLWADDAEWVIGRTGGQPCESHSKGIDEIESHFRDLRDDKEYSIPLFWRHFPGLTSESHGATTAFLPVLTSRSIFLSLLTRQILSKRTGKRSEMIGSWRVRAGPSATSAGSTVTVIPVGATDTDHSSVVHVPGLSLVVSGDVVYNQTRMWMAGSTPDSRASWVKALDTVAGLGADTVIAGHRNPHAPDDDARRQIGECRRQIADFEAALERSSTPAELIDRMTETYPDLANPYTLWVAAYD